MKSLLASAILVLVICYNCSAQHVFEYLELGRGSSGEDLVSARLELAKLPASFDDIVSLEIVGFQGFVFGDGKQTGIYDGTFDESIGEFIPSAAGGLTRSEIACHHWECYPKPTEGHCHGKQMPFLHRPLYFPRLALALSC